MKFLKILAFCTLILITNLLVSAQGTTSKNKIKLAETFENNGEYDNSSRLYLELLNEYPNNETFLYGLSRSLIALNKYSELIPTLEKYVKSKPSNKLLNLYAEVLWKLGKIDSAKTAWQNAINNSPKQIDSYKNTSISQANQMQFQAAIETLLKAREQFKDNKIFVDELGKLYTAIGDYKNAVNEIFVLFETQRNYPQTQGRLQALTITGDAKNYILNILKSKKDSENKAYKILYAWFLSLIEDYESSLKIYSEIDKESNSNGAELYSFALARQKDSQFEIALKAFSKVMDYGKKSPYFLNAMYGYNRVIETKMLLNKKFNASEYEDLVNKYRDIIALYPNNNFAFEAQFRIALIYINNLKKVENAIIELNALSKNLKNNLMIYKVYNLLGDIYLYKDEIDIASNYYMKSASIPNNNLENEKYYAMFKLADILFYKGEIDSSINIYNNLALNVNANIANDAFEKGNLIQANKHLIKALNNYAIAEKYLLQDKDSLALIKIGEAINFASGDLKEISIIKKVEILNKNKEYNESIELLNNYIDTFPESIHLDEIYFELGNIYQLNNQLNQAESILTKLLEKFPRSIYIEKTRNKIREIRNQMNS